MLHNPQPGNYKKFNLGVDQLLKEGVARRFEFIGSGPKAVLLAAVGPLQFEVLEHRLKGEYNADCRVEGSPWQIARWWRKPGVPALNPAEVDFSALPDTPDGVRLAFDDRGRSVALFTDDLAVRFFARRNEGIELSPIPFGASKAIAAAERVRG